MTWKVSKEEPMKTYDKCTIAECTTSFSQEEVGMGRTRLASRKLTY